MHIAFCTLRTKSQDHGCVYEHFLWCYLTWCNADSSPCPNFWMPTEDTVQCVILIDVMQSYCEQKQKIYYCAFSVSSGTVLYIVIKHITHNMLKYAWMLWCPLALHWHLHCNWRQTCDVCASQVKIGSHVKPLGSQSGYVQIKITRVEYFPFWFLSC